MSGPGWVQPPEQRQHPKSSQVVFIPDVVAVWTPCHGARVFLPSGEAVPGLRAEWTGPDTGERR